MVLPNTFLHCRLFLYSIFGCYQEPHWQLGLESNDPDDILMITSTTWVPVYQNKHICHSDGHHCQIEVLVHSPPHCQAQHPSVPMSAVFSLQLPLSPLVLVQVKISRQKRNSTLSLRRWIIFNCISVWSKPATTFIFTEHKENIE